MTHSRILITSHVTYAVMTINNVQSRLFKISSSDCVVSHHVYSSLPCLYRSSLALFHIVSHPTGLKSSGFTAVLDAVAKYGRAWRKHAINEPSLLPLLVRVGESGPGQITLSGLAKQLESSADIASAFRQPV